MLPHRTWKVKFVGIKLLFSIHPNVF
jgi:hypothetical protein